VFPQSDLVAVFVCGLLPLLLPLLQCRCCGQIMNRNLPVPQFTANESNGKVTITTSEGACAQAYHGRLRATCG
jgi:hypothetical protein